MIGVPTWYPVLATAVDALKIQKLKLGGGIQFKSCHGNDSDYQVGPSVRVIKRLLGLTLRILHIHGCIFSRSEDWGGRCLAA